MKVLLDHDVPDDVIYSLQAVGHEIYRLRDEMPPTTQDADVLQAANARGQVLITCNRDDFLSLAENAPHSGIIILIRRRSRAMERAALIQLLDAAGEVGIVDNINFA